MQGISNFGPPPARIGRQDPVQRPLLSGAAQDQSDRDLAQAERFARSARETMSQKRDVNEEKTCACGAKMIKYRFVDEKGRESVRWVCSMGFLCRHRRKKAA